VVLVDAGLYPEHTQVIRIDFKPELVKKYRDVKNGQFQEKWQKVLP
jgi:hypothetical protein